MREELIVSPNVVVPSDELSFTFARSSGPGGQNVNKVNSKAVLRWNVVASTSLPQDVRERFLKENASRINRDGVLVLSSDAHREQLRNRTECLELLRRLLIRAAKRPQRRIKTRPSRAAVERRLNDKRHRARKKRDRGSADF